MRVLRVLVPLGVLAVAAVIVAQAPARQARPSADCSQTSTGLMPLTDMGKRRYKGQRGGLYPNGSNQPPPWYLKQGLAAAKRVRPIRGRIVVLSIGMSNTSQEFQAFVRFLDGDPTVNTAIKPVDGGIGSWDARRISKASAGYWRAVDRRLAAAGLTRKDVQVVWLKESISGEERQFPSDANALRANLRSIAQIVARRYRNVRLIYGSSRIYGGYAVTALNPEPAAYDSGYAVRGLIQDRMQGKLRGPWIGWGPYLWADGLKARSDGLTWSCDDVRKDGTHPSPTGAAKVARLLLQFFKADPTTKTWFSPAA